MSNKIRISVAALALSAAGFIGIVSDESYTTAAVIPTKGDVPTVGFGSTFHEDGRPVRMGDTTTPVRALAKVQSHISKDEAALRRCLGDTPMYQHEYDAVVSWSYNVGTQAACSSTLVRKLRAGDYVGACNELTKWKYAAGREIHGLVLRRARERNQCLGLTATSDESQGGK